MARIGVQAMMLRHSVSEVGAYETMRRTAAVGYRVVEVSQIPLTPETLSQLERSREDFGIEFASISAALDAGGANDSLEESFDKIVADARSLGASMVRIGMLPIPALRTRDTLLDFCDRADAAALTLREHGIGLHYHNHHIEFAKVDGRFLLDVIAERSPNVGIELDAHWIARGGLDPVRVIDEYAGRVRLVHLKDYRVVLPDAAAIDAHVAGDRQAWHHNAVQFAEVGEGNLDWPSIISHSIDAGAEFLLVEQDELYGRTVWESLSISREHLVELGYTDLF